MTPTERAIEKLPPHLRRYVVAQDYEAYTPRDHAVWRHILTRLKVHLADKAHPVYLEGLEATGIGTERIPRLDEMNERLARLGWSAVAVRGFIPPAVFTELQTMGVLAIATDIRTHEHIEYTPAPDIVHESAGHAPIIANARYAEYLKACGKVGFKAIASVEDQAMFAAIRNLSVVKEDPSATAEDTALAEQRLVATAASRRYVSECTKASRLYWWTAEYGLVGDLARPRIFGAGILGSLGEARYCLTDAVRKVPHGLVCTETEYDITRMQPQLFVARDFEHLFEVLAKFEETLAWKRGGDFGLEQAQRARTVNHLVLGDGLELTGTVVDRVASTRTLAPGLSTAVARLAGPVMTSRNGQAETRPWPGQALVVFGDARLPARGPFSFELSSGLLLTGFAIGGGEVVNLRGHLDGRPLDLPSWALLFTSPTLPSVAGGPADPGTWDRWFGDMNAFAAGEGELRAQQRKAAALPGRLAELYRDLHALREQKDLRIDRLHAIREAAGAFPDDWILKAEVDELLGAKGKA